jgi:hypothetical protein
MEVLERREALLHNHCCFSLGKRFALDDVVEELATLANSR